MTMQGGTPSCLWSHMGLGLASSRGWEHLLCERLWTPGSALSSGIEVVARWIIGGLH